MDYDDEFNKLIGDEGSLADLNVFEDTLNVVPTDLIKETMIQLASTYSILHEHLKDSRAKEPRLEFQEGSEKLLRLTKTLAVRFNHLQTCNQIDCKICRKINRKNE